MTHNFFNPFSVLVACVALWMLNTSSALEHNEYINATICIRNQTESVNLPCGNVPEKATAIEWFAKNLKEWERILKFYINTNRDIQYYNNYSREKYDISDSVNTSLVVMNIVPSSIGVFKCTASGGIVEYSYTTLLKIVGKFLLGLVFYNFNLPTDGEFMQKCTLT